MTKLTRYWVNKNQLFTQQPIGRVAYVPVIGAAEVEQALIKQCRVIRLLVDTGHKWDGYTLDYAEASRLLAQLGGTA